MAIPRITRNPTGNLTSEDEKVSPTRPFVYGLLVVHAGADANFPRPQGNRLVYWICNAGVSPVNKIPGDLLFNANP